MTMFWYSTIGNDILNNTKYFTDFPLFGGNRSTRMRDLSWKPGADNSKAKLPILDSQDGWKGAKFLLHRRWFILKAEKSCHRVYFPRILAAKGDHFQLAHLYAGREHFDFHEI